MPRNPYISLGTKREQATVENLLIEALRIYSIECYYLPRGIINRDFLLNEVIESKFDDAFKVEMYLQDVEAYGGDGQFLGKFGLEIRDQLNLVVARKRWDQLVGNFNVNGRVRPGEGDLIYIPMVKGLFEISFVKGDSPFYQLANLPLYTMTCELFEYSNERLDTNVAEIDQVEDLEATRVILTVGAAAITYRVGEAVSQVLDSDTTVNGQIASVTATTISVTQTRATDSDLFWQVTAGGYGNAIGAISGITSPITAVDDIVFDQDPLAQNDGFESDGNSWIDFSETNPFGDANVWGE